MTDVNITVDAGACRFKTFIQASVQDDLSVKFTVRSECPNVKNLALMLDIVDAMDVVADRITDNVLMKKCSEFIPHPACPIPCALVKACEVASDLAVKKDAVITFE